MPDAALSESLLRPELVTSWIDGAPTSPGANASRLPIVDPATEETIAHLAVADAAEVDAAVASARTAFERGDWSRASLETRQKTLRALADLIDAHAEELIALEVAHTGLPVQFLRAMHLPRTAYNFRFFAEFIGQMAGQSWDQAQGFETRVTREPIGVAALIAPWNVPLGLGLMKVAGCIAFGNSCVLKPSEQTPLSFPLVMELANRAGLPPGVVNLVNGPGAETGRALTEHPGVDAVSFTGGTATGRAIGAAAGAGLKPFTMELGGKSANIVFDDADLDEAVKGAVIAAFSNNGQQCLAGARILLQDAIADAFIEKFLAAAREMRIGDPRNPGTQLGPLQSKAHMERVLSFVTVAEGDGCRVLTGGGRAEGFDRGYYIDPIVVEAPSNAAQICQEEVFGPFATILRFGTADEAIRIADDSPFGLVGYVWTRDIGRAQAVSHALRAGVVWVNTSMMRELRAPFGGYKASGVGREGGEACARLFTEEKTVTYRILDPR